MSKYRPATLPKGNSEESSEGGAVPPVRTRAEIRAEWEERQREEQAAAASTQHADPAESAEADGGGQTQQEPPVEEVSVTSAARSDEGEVAEPPTVSVESALPETSGDEVELSGEDGGLVHLPANRDDLGFVAMPAFSEPTSSDPKERLDHYARGVVAAEYASRANVQRAHQQKIIVQGQNLLAMKKEKLWEVLGLPDFDALVQQRFNYGKNYANKLIRTMPVVRALELVTSMELAEKHLRPLVPVQDRHGDEAVRETWDEALRKGKITEKALREAAYFLGYGDPIEQDGNSSGGQRRAATGSSSSARVRSVEEAFGAIRSLMQTDSEQARKEALELWKLAEELRAELGIEIAPTGV
ncbi:hypothetical protein [Streptomyces sp. RKAG337]|uniref:hypothetical protein n=1 Tax=Streptomyces sp. RKAG337 TaxID=2893404 RepID=UPI0020346CBA|nr:hypothetical protein [Streptomyces sp. RKAG337]MCM2431051.1 hypothetical protein [Streptomyces sp. RKAG337]